ncbi:MAG TPA: TerC family protein [Armatimonadota bacterium]|jgi:tellurite resistance protein TerC
MTEAIYLWVGFNLFVLAMLALDLGIIHRQDHVVTLREALTWSGVWISLALLFNALLYLWRGPDIALQFLTGYLIEKSLSVDNIFVMLTLFTYFKVPGQYQHKVLFWGIIGALVMRAIFIVLGIAAIEKFHWVIYLFGVLLLVTGVRMAVGKEREVHPERNPVLRAFQRVMPVTPQYVEGHFFVRQAGRRWATPLMVVLLLIETSDLIFAVDSIPAILAVSQDTFVVYTSNVFAILGLRSLYFALSGMVQRFRYLHYGLAAILIFIGAKMLLTDLVHVPILVTLGMVLGILLLSILASLRVPRAADA